MTATRGAVAAGHPLTAEAGAAALRAGGNAVDAAIAAVLTSCVTESPLTGLGAGGYVLVHSGDENALLDFFVEAPGRGGLERSEELVAIPIHFTEETTQVFHIGAASAGVPGTPVGLAEVSRRFGSMPLSELGAFAIRLAREGVRVNAEQAFFLEILADVLTFSEEGAAIYSPQGRILGEDDLFRFPELGDAIERLGADGAEPFYRGEVADRLSDWIVERGGTLGRDDLSAYEPIWREPVVAEFEGRRILTNPPPSSGGILIVFALDLLDRLREKSWESVVAAMEAAQSMRTEDFLTGLLAPGFADRFLAPEVLDATAKAVAERRRLGLGPLAADERLGSTTHITAVDAEGMCASVTCSNGVGCGLVVPGTGVHLNSMLGEQDLNPHGFHRHAPGTRLPSMMSPTVVLRDGELELGLGSGGSNRIRSAILQTIIRLVGQGNPVDEAVVAPRVHVEEGVVQAEPGVDPEVLSHLEARGYEVVRWPRLNVFFGGVHAVSRDLETGALQGGGDLRRGGAVAYG